MPSSRVLYAAQAGQFLWSRNHALTRPAIDVIAQLRAAETVGLRAADYDANRLARLASGLTSASGDEQWALFDIGLSAALYAYAHDVHAGRIDPRAAGLDLEVAHSRLDFVPLAQGLSHSNDVAGVLRDIEPPFLHYDLLKKSLQRYRELAQEPELTQLPALPAKSVKPGQAYAGAAQLRHLLTALGDMPATSQSAGAADAVLDDGLADALRSFRSATGWMRRRTRRGHFRCIDDTPECTRAADRAHARALALAATAIDHPPILVNIPRFRLLAFRSTADHEDSMLTMNVIVGKSYPTSRTPVFSADMKYIVLRPYWDVPYSITVKEMLPRIRDNPAYLAAQRIEIVGRLRRRHAGVAAHARESRRASAR